MGDPEVDAIGKIDAALSAIKDLEGQQRVLLWAFAKYGNKEVPTPIFTPKPGGETRSPLVSSSGNKREMAGIAQLQDNGNFKLTVRDLKAKNTNDAAIRLAHIVVHAYTTLTEEASVSSKKVLMPILREWRAYDGNTRGALAKHKGIIREGDLLSLDAHSKKDAEQFVGDVLDNAIEGKWSPPSMARKRKQKTTGGKS